MEISKKQELASRALKLRIDSMRSTTASKSGHPTTALSAADIVSVLFFNSMNFNINNPYYKNNDRLIMSKGHGIPVVYSAYKQLGVISDEELLDLRKFDSVLEGHPTPRFIYNEAATGSLGQGLAIGAGMAINGKFENLSYKTYVILGDGELAEGSIWEAAAFGSFNKLSNLIAIVDCNRLGQTGETLYGHDCQNYVDKFKAFGWNSMCIDGHSIDNILSSIDLAASSKLPTAIIAKTLKGYGLDEIEDKNGFHGKPLKKEELEKYIDSLKNRFLGDYEYGESNKLFNTDKINIDLDNNSKKEFFKKEFWSKEFWSKEFCKIKIDIESDKNSKLFDMGESIATRKAFGYALASLGRESKDIFVIDADVKNSTFTNIFEEEFSDRFIQTFIAEQTMVGVATGLETRGKIPFASTFGAFFTRAHDQIRMAGIGRNSLRLCGSHCGVSIGEDGPSQMGLEDISMMRSIPGSIVLYPSDGVSTYKLVEEMGNYNSGISYLRTTRSGTNIIYNKSESFIIGGSKVLRKSDKDICCIVSAGITLHEALKAYELLSEKNIFVSIIDAYSIKPLDIDTIVSTAKESGNKILTVEDHYIEGGLGEAVAASIKENIKLKILGVNKISRSGDKSDLMRYAGIDSQSIIEAVGNFF